MRQLINLSTLTAAAAVLLALAATSVAADVCTEPQVVRLQDGNEAVRVNLAELEGGDWVRACLDVRSGRRIDWYLTSQSAADAWMTNARAHYTLSNQPYSQSPTTVYHSRLDTSGFSAFDFEITDRQAGHANERFAVIVHATGDCLGGSNACVTEVSVGKLGRVPWTVIIVCTVLSVLFCCCCIAGIVYCCRKASGADEPQQKDVVVVHHEHPAPQQHEQGYPAQPKTV